MIYDYFRVTGAHDTVLDYADLFTITLRSDDAQEFVTRLDEILLSMTKIPPDDVLESSYKLRIRESDQIKNVLKLYDLEIHQKKSKPDDQRLNTMVKKSIDQKLRLRNFVARNERIVTGAVVTNRRVNVVFKEDKEHAINGKQQDSLREEIGGRFRHDEDKRAKPKPKTARPSERASRKRTSEAWVHL